MKSNLACFVTMRKYYLLFILFVSFVSCTEEPESSYVLKVSVLPNDAGQVTPSEGEFSSGEVVQLTPTANSNYEFEKWTGDWVGIENPLSITMNIDKTIIANFKLMDSDNDGVTDDIDTCADTPSGETVDENGCSDSQKDSDNDGVTDATDTCADTPSGETVDENGCSDSQKDSDNDGVTDATDTCADTPSGETVDENGCSDSQKDLDEDGFIGSEDCDDTNDTINPNAIEVCDGVDNNCDGVIDEQGCNNPPSISEVILSPSNPRKDDTILTSVNADDIDGDILTYEYKWFINSQQINTESSILANGFVKNDFIYCIVTAFDGTDYSMPVQSNVLTVINTPPQFNGNISISPSNPNPNSVLQVIIGPTLDNDGDTVSFIYSWYVNGLDINQVEPLLSSNYFNAGDRVFCRVTPFDGTDYGLSIASSTVTIGD